MITWRAIALGIVVIFGSQSSNGQQRVPQNVVESLSKMFGDTISVSRRTVILLSEEQATVFERSKTRWATDTVDVYICSTTNGVRGYGFVDDVKGKTQLITYLVGILPGGTVQDVDVLAYREAYGGEITHASFRKQFQNKTVQDKLQPGKDIKNISGATISVRAITYGVKRILATFALITPRLQQR